MINLQEQVKKSFCYKKLFWPFTVCINCSRDLKIFANSQPSASNFKFFSRSLEQFFITVGQNNFGNKIPFLTRKERCTHFSFMVPKNFLWNSICSTDNASQVDHISNSNINIMVLVTTFTSKTVASQYLCCWI